MRSSIVRRMLIAGLACGVAVPAGVTAARAQTPSLGELAKQEQERRKTQKTPAKVYTKKDLPPSPPPPSSVGATPGAAAPESKAPEKKGTEEKKAEEKTEKTEKDEKDEKDEAWWKNRIEQVREEKRRNEMFAEALQTRINSLSTDFVNRDDPYQRAKIGEDRDKAIAELGRVKADIELAKKKIDDIEEEARKADVPPGWLR